MTIQEFIISKVDELANIFSWLNISYEYKGRSDVHFIKLSPLEYLKKDPAILSTVNNIHLEFIKSFPGEHIAFVADDSFVEIINPIYKRNQRFTPTELILNSWITDSLFKTFTPQVSGYDFQFNSLPNYEHLIQTVFVPTVKVLTTFPNNLFFNASLIEMKAKKPVPEKVESNSMAKAA